MRTTSTHRTARLAAVLGALPLALVVATSATGASAVAPAKLGPVAPSSAHSTIADIYVPQESLESRNGAGRGTTQTAGSRGNADDKNPRGQRGALGDLGTTNAVADGNKGYECNDGNNGIALGNPAHSRCAGLVTLD